MEEAGRQKVAIVGGGISGLVSIKACLEEGLHPHCFEMNSDLGGVWYTPDTPKLGSGAQMYDCLITNTCKAMMCFSDFPFPASYPPYMPYRLLHPYLQSYAKHFGLVQYMMFNTKVLNVSKADDYDATGRWTVTTCRVEGGIESEEKKSEIFDKVMLCQGNFTIPHFPHVPGLEERFQGTVSHANTYKNSKPYKDRVVVVVGCASSAGDLACDIAPVAKQVYLSIHTGRYCMSRLQNGLTPLDFSIRRVVFDYLPKSLIRRVMHSTATKWLDPVMSGLQPAPSTPSAHVNAIINDQLPFKIITGQVKVVETIEKVSDTGDLHLNDGKVLSEVDDIIFGTGYNCDFSIIDPSIVFSDLKSGRMELYKMTFPVSLPHDSLAVVSFFRITGAIPPLIEIQTRLIARVFSGRHTLPDRVLRQRDVDHLNSQKFQEYGSYNYQFVSLEISDDIAAELGVRPSWLRLLLQGDVKMALAVTFGPAYPFHYRLMGPHSWSGARDATLNAYKEIISATQHRSVAEGAGKGCNLCGPFYLLLWLPVLAACVYYFCFCT